MTGSARLAASPCKCSGVAPSPKPAKLLSNLASFFGWITFESSRRRARGLLPFCLLLGVGPTLLHCSSDEDDPSGPFQPQPGGNVPRDNTVVIIEPPGGKPQPPDFWLNALCGEGACLPDAGEICEGAPEETPLGEGGAGGEPAWGTREQSCQVQRAASCSGEECAVERSCQPIGQMQVGEPCFGSADCSAGLACVGEGEGGGSCRPYCCEGTLASCSNAEFCEVRPLVEEKSVRVPVCMPVGLCSPVDPFPCSAGDNCSCPEGKACQVVRPDGQTACTAPGVGKEGAACTGREASECAPGYVCSLASGCMKLCSTIQGVGPSCTEGAICQTPPEFPSDWGVCVSSSEGIAAR